MSELPTWIVVRLRTATSGIARRDEGQGLVEYILILAFVAILVILALVFLKDKIIDIFSKTGNSLT